MSIAFFISWACQLILIYFFLRSAFRKARGFERVSAEFQGWGYPFPDQITFFLIGVWILCSAAFLVPESVGISAVILMGFMIVACVTLIVNGEFRRLVEPARPIILLAIVIGVRWHEILALAKLAQ